MMVNWLIHKHIAGTRLWFGFVFCAAIACMFQASLSLSPIWSIMVPNTLILVGLFMLTRGVERFFSVQTHQLPWYVLAAIFFPSFIYFTFVEPSFLIRVIVNYMVWLLAMGLCLRALFLGQNKRISSFSPAHWTFAIACFCLLSVFTLRLSMLGSYEHSDTLGTNNWVNQFFSLSVIVMPLILCFSLCLLCSCRKEQQLAELTRNAKRESQKKERFLTLLSHELRTPLNAIVGHAELIKKAPREPLKYQQYCDVIISTAMSLADLANQVLLNARGKSSTQVPVNLSQFADLLIGQFKPLLQEKGVELRTQLTGIACDKEYLIDQDSIGLVVKNLLSNAIKYTQSGSITLSITQQSLTHQAETVRFEVKDTGAGMTAEQIELLFKPFTSSDPARSIAHSAGVGLVLCQQILEVLKTKLHVVSELGRGSSFYFDIELSEAIVKNRQEQTNSYQPQAVSQLCGDILIVEDNQLNQEILKHLLSSLGLNYEIAATLSAAEAALNRAQFDVIFLDMHLTDGHGLDWYRRVFKSFDFKQAPVVVAITGDVDEQSQQAYRIAGIEHFMAKPIQQKLLEKLLAQLLMPARHFLAEKSMLDYSVIDELVNTMSPQVLSAKLMYLSDRLDYEFAQLRGLADIQAFEALEEKLIQLEEEAGALGMCVLHIALQDVRLSMFDSLNADWQALHSLAKHSARCLSDYHSKALQ
ncbi:hybrid sensor histidine kinase/response regulator [Pseudoalteromonas luteoviolacea]|uniref:hybrid sensor histidine kinase/response regulator n=1 Tax=Pseudoalteromonas luteoviolacea TaxID=43657 RepID=UPI001B37319D|nr:ATP-binding protein [Pseudoalteromonas luteoviolacea]MBQ4840107.1 response regulator [Pseudoalteromonas luteoviolacea]